MNVEMCFCGKPMQRGRQNTVNQTAGGILRHVHTLIYEDDAHALEQRVYLISELTRRGFTRIACYKMSMQMPWLIGRNRRDDCFFAAWHRFRKHSDDVEDFAVAQARRRHAEAAAAKRLELDRGLVQHARQQQVIVDRRS